MQGGLLATRWPARPAVFALPSWRRVHGALSARHTPAVATAGVCVSKVYLRRPLQGGSHLPFPKPGYWAPFAEGGPNLTATLRVYDAPGIDALPTSPPIFQQCDSGKCKGGSRFECEAGYTGNLCNRCEIGHLYWRGTCKTRCEDMEAQALVNVLGIIAVVTVWLLMNRMTAGQ